MPKFIKSELKPDSDSEVESKYDAELMAKIKFDSDNDSGYDTVHWLFYLHGWLQIKMILINNYK